MNFMKIKPSNNIRSLPLSCPLAPGQIDLGFSIELARAVASQRNWICNSGIVTFYVEGLRATNIHKFLTIMQFFLSKSCKKWCFFSCLWQLNRWPCPLVGWAPLTIRVYTTLQSDPKDLWPLRHLIRVMKRHDLTEKIPTYLHTYPPTYLPTHLPTHPPTSRTEHPQGAILETCDF